ncbi:hypothetical protein Tco_0295360 [Tanacetum coccineum]
MIKHFSKLEVEHLNLKLKYQHLKERFGNKNSVTSSDAPAFESVFEIGNLKEQLQGRGNTIRELKAKISRLQKKHSEADPILDFKALDSLNKDLNAKAQLKGKIKCVTMPDLMKPKVLAPGVKDATATSGSKPMSNTKKDRTLPAKSDTKKVEEHSRNNKSSVKQKNRVDSSISYKRTVINSNSNSICKTCNKCLMSFNHDKCVVRSLKFVKKSPVNKIWKVKQVKQVWQATGKLFTNIGFQWQPTSRKFTLGE